MRILAVLVALSLGLKFAAAEDINLIPNARVECGGYSIWTFQDPITGDGAFAFFREKRRLFTQAGEAYDIGTTVDLPRNAPRLCGQDLTATGAPHVVIYAYTGGAHCCSSAHVFRLGETVEELAVIEGKHSTPEFVPAGPHEPWRVRVRDWTFAYRLGCSFADSAAPEVWLRWNGQRYVVDKEQMKKMPLSRRSIARLAATIRKSPVWHSKWDEEKPSELMQTALDLMYSGQVEFGWKFIADAWAPGHHPPPELYAELRELLGKSKYWCDLGYTIPAAP